jgi:hypothetical protein
VDTVKGSQRGKGIYLLDPHGAHYKVARSAMLSLNALRAAA